MKKINIQISEMSEISETIEKIEVILKQRKVEKSNAMFSCMAIEDVLVELIKEKKQNSKINITISKLIDSLKITIISEGKEIDLASIYCNQFAKKLSDVSEEEKLEDYAIRNAIMNANEKNFKHLYKNGFNYALFKINIGSQKMLIWMLLALVLGVIFGFTLKLNSLSTVAKFLDENIFDSVSTIFFNALDIVIGPLVFFSIAASISSFGDVKRIGKVGGKVMLGYTFTSVIAALIGFTLVKVTNISMNQDIVASSKAIEQTQSISIKDTLVNIVPSNFLAPFVEGNMLQVLFLAFVVGITISLLTEYKDILINIVNACNGLIQTITQGIIQLMPLAIFCIIASLIYNLGVGTLASLIPCVLGVIAAYICMFIVYALLIWIVARLNPIKHFKKMLPSMMTAFSTRSSGATIPVTMNCCDKEGVSPSLYSFSIPFGASINMDASCMLLIISTLFFANSFGVTLSGVEVVTLLFTVIIFSMSAPGIPGSSIAFFTLLAIQIGLPVEALALFVTISTFIDPIATLMNVTGDTAMTLVVAKNEKMIDLEKFNE